MTTTAGTTVPPTEFVTVHGHRRAYALGGRELGTAPVLLLLHGLACNRHTWDPVWDRLGEHYTLLAPDLLGHGESDKPRGDYSPGGFANGMRDLLTILGIDKVTVVGHSFGGAVGMQFAYQFPERTERLVLVNAGGLGKEVTVAIRALGLPGYQYTLGLLTAPGVRQLNTTVLRALKATGLRDLRDLGEVADILETLKEPRARYAVHKLVTGVMDWRGQNITMRDRAYLTELMPLCVIWGEDDRVLPAHHAQTATDFAPRAQVTVMPDTGHFPHKDHPDDFAAVVEGFIDSTIPATYSRARWRRLLKTGAPAPVLRAVQDEDVASELA
jgi:pimeloyl-ACP methyl ester carboxylesterase